MDLTTGGRILQSKLFCGGEMHLEDGRKISIHN